MKNVFEINERTVNVISRIDTNKVKMNLINLVQVE